MKTNRSRFPASPFPGVLVSSIVLMLSLLGTGCGKKHDGGEDVDSKVFGPGKCGKGKNPCGELCCDSKTERCGDGVCRPRPTDGPTGPGTAGPGTASSTGTPTIVVPK